MKYRLLRFSLLSMLVMFFGGNVFADQITMKYSGTTTTNMTGNNDAALLGLDADAWSVVGAKGSNSNFPGLNKNGDFRLYYHKDGSNTITVSSLKDATINSISMTFNGSYSNVSVTVNGNAVEANDGSYVINSSSFVLGNANTSNIQVQIKEIVINYTAAASNKTATTVTLAEGYATSGVVGGTIDLPTATVKAGDTPIDALVTWTSSNEDVAKIDGSNINLLAAGTAKITASYAGDDANEASSASFTVTVYVPYTTIAAMLENITTTKTNASYTFENLLVRYVNGKYTYVTDGKDNMLFYGSDLGLVAGYIIKGSVKGQLYTYSGLPELSLNASDITVEVASSNNEVIPSIIELDALANNINNYITIENATYVSADNKKLTFKIGENSFIAYNQFGLDVTGLEAGKVYNITGFGSINNSTNQIYPTSIEEVATASGFRDFAVNLTNADAIPTTSNSFGVKVAEDGTYTAVAADDATANFTVNAARFNDAQHGWVNCVFTVPVQGAVKIELGDCQYGGQNGTITDSEGNKTEIKANATKKCWAASAPHDNVVVAYYAGTAATTLTITYNGYCPFIAVTAIDPSEIPSEATLTYSIGESGAEGVAPVAQKVEIGSKVKVPANTTLFVEGKTLTAWTDGTNQYKAGDEVTVSEDITLTPVFTENTVTFADRTAETTLVWQFGESNGAGTLNAQGKSTILVTQATIGEAVIDVKMAIDATNGKINNVGRGDEWAQCNDGTILTIPAYKGTAVSFKSNSDGAGTTIGGVEATDKAATYEGTAETLDIVAKGMGYISNVTAVYPVPSGEEPVKVDVNVTFSIEGAECQGQLVAEGGAYKSGDDFTLPAKNFTLYKEGFTQTGWTDGENTYEMGQVVSLPEKDITFVPLFTANEASLADRTEAVTVKFDFQRQNGAPSVQWQNQENLVWVAQAEVNGKTIDVPTNFSTNPGKFNNTAWGDWCQLNNGTTFAIPSCKGATISVQAYNELTELTIDGQNDYTSAKTISYTVASSAETVDVVIGSEGSYYKYIQVVLPVVQSQGGGESFDNADMSVEWPMLVEGNVDLNNYTATPAKAISVASFEYSPTDATVATGSRSADPDNGLKFVTFTGENVQTHWFVKPAAGLTFTPTQIKLYVQRFGTNKKDGVVVTAKVGDEGETTTLGTFTARRANWTDAQEEGQWKEVLSNLVNEIVIDLTEAQQAALASGEGFHLYATTGLANNKAGGFADCRVYGKVSGTVASVSKYTLAVAAAPEDAGTVSKYPAADEYEEGSEVTLTATENFGYDFVNWTNAAGEEVSTEAKFKYTVNADETLTANFKAVETYELALTVDGTNDYMVTVSPAPTVVDGKNMYEAGTTVELTANQYEGLVTFTNWSDGETASNKIIKMEDNVTITAVYAQADIIAGWDFYKAGNSCRKADFAAQDNDADALSLVNTETGEASGWLDKSTLGGGGYESFKGAAVNWRTGASNGDVGNWHWQTKVNAEAFTDINVQFQMLYNYNAYQTYNVEYSLDGETWTKFGDITMSGAKAPASFNETLPAEANNQKDLYIRMLADKSSSVDGAASANDGNTLAMFFITGTPKLVDDPVAPALVSSVPAEGATGTSARGKIVLTFDKKVQVAEGTKATLGALELTPAVSGKVITFEYKGLEYSTEYTFNLPANTVSNLTGATLAEAITLTFTTMTRPTVTKGLYDQVVSTADELVAAIAAAQARADKNVRYRIFIKNGEYTIPLSQTTKTVNGYEVPECITFINTQNLSLIGESRDGVIITNGIDKNATFAGTYGTTSKYDGIGNSDVFQLSGSDYYFQDLTIESGMEDGTGRDLAIQDKATRTIYKNTGLRGYQDTWTSNNNNGLYYFEGGYLRGRTDYMCGKGDAFFNGVELRQIYGGYAAVPSNSIKYGYVYKDCVINGEESPAVYHVVNGVRTPYTAAEVDGNYTLGRPWGKGTPSALFIDTKMNVVPSAIGWNEMSGGYPKRFAEYNSTTSTGSVIDLSGRKKTFDAYDSREEQIVDGQKTYIYTNRRDEANNPVLTAEEALEAGNMSNMFGDWDPTLATEQAPVPANVKLAGTTLTWDDSNYALLYAIVKNGSVVDFTTEATFTVDDATATYAVRAANEMGGLGEAAEATAVEEGPTAYEFVASEWQAGDAARISADNVTVDTEANTITVDKTGQNNVALIFRSANTYTVKAEQRYFVIKGTGLSTAEGANYLWWLNNTNNGSQIAPTATYEENGNTVFAWDCALIAIGGQLGIQDTEFTDQGGWSTTFGLTLADEAKPAVISYIGFETTIPDPVQEYEYEFVASEWPAGDPGRISAANVTVDETANTITVNATGDNNVALNFKTDNVYYITKPVKYFVIKATGLSTEEGKSYLWWLNAKNNGAQVVPTSIGMENGVTVFAWDITTDATFASGFNAEGKSYLDGTGASTWGWTTTFGMTLADANVPAVISYIGYLPADAEIPTGISTLKVEMENGTVYNLNGQKVNKAKKGLYIINGRKVVIK